VDKELQAVLVMELMLAVVLAEVLHLVGLEVVL